MKRRGLPRKVTLILASLAILVLGFGARPLWRELSLAYLLHRLEGEWELEETMKAYFIGYTDDMEAIARFGDEAVPRLVSLARTTSSGHTQMGSLLAIHLIGIEGEVVGRMTEAFKSCKARTALLGLLDREDCQRQVLELLIRDPWPSDVPVLLSHLESGGPHAWALVKALQRYDIAERPVHQELPPEVAARLEVVRGEDGLDAAGELWRIFLLALEMRIVVEPAVWGQMLQSVRAIPGRPLRLTSREIESLTKCNYSHLGDVVDFYLAGDRIVICSTTTARRRWLDWYRSWGRNGSRVVGSPQEFAFACCYGGLDRLKLRLEWNPGVISHRGGGGWTALHGAAMPWSRRSSSLVREG